VKDTSKSNRALKMPRLSDDIKIDMRYDKTLVTKEGKKLYSYRSKRANIIVIHHTATTSTQRTRSAFMSRNASTHYEIDRDGTIYQYLSPIYYVAWHVAGFNYRSIGIDLTHPTGADFTLAQTKSLAKLLDMLCTAFGITKTVAPKTTQYFSYENGKDGKKHKRCLTLPTNEFGIYRHSNLAQTQCPDGAPIEEALNFQLRS
jgi:hypothetical protein